MKRIILATSLGIALLSFVTANTDAHATAPNSNLVKQDTVPTDTTQPAPKDTTTIVSFNQ